MRKLLFFALILPIFTLQARSTLSIGFYPERKTSFFSLSHSSEARAWSGRLAYSDSDGLTIPVPFRGMVSGKDATLSIGYRGFWQTYVLIPFFSQQQALHYQRKSTSLMLFSAHGGRRAVGYEVIRPHIRVSTLVWQAPRHALTSYQTAWSPKHAQWGVGGKVVVRSSPFVIHGEALFTPSSAVQGYISSSFTLRTSSLLVAYGERAFPLRSVGTLTHSGKRVQIRWVIDDRYGAKPLYGGDYAPRQRTQKASVKLLIAQGYLTCSATDHYIFTIEGTKKGESRLGATLVGPVGELRLFYTTKRVHEKQQDQKEEFQLSLVVYKATFTLSEGVYTIGVSDSFFIGSGIATWKMEKRWGREPSLSFFYSLTIDR